MSAVSVTKRSLKHVIFSAPFAAWEPREILDYFLERKTVSYFAIADEAEVSREKIDAILANRFSFNAESYQFDNSPDWLNNPSRDIEWAIMLHKFYYAVGLGMAFQETGNARYAEKWIKLTSSWIETVPIDILSSDVAGRRVQNWIFAHFYFVSECSSKAITPEFYLRFLESIHDQVEWLCHHLTPARNHRTLELYTIFLAAVVFPEFKKASDWLKFSIDELRQNIEKDILDDGVHCELSTDYHHIVLRNFLAVKRLATLNAIALPEAIDDKIKKALEFSLYVHKPDGSIPSLSDGDTGDYLKLLAQGYEFYGCEHLKYAATAGREGLAPPFTSIAFPSGGYYIMRSGWGDALDAYRDERHLVFDCGAVGEGNHGHLDLLSFEMAAYGQSLIVDPGRFTYDEVGEVNWRVLFRGTSYHNTVQVDGLNQTRYEFHKKKFKITGQHPEYELKSFFSRPGLDFVHGIAKSHEYPVVHERKILFIEGEYWIICDVLRADENHQYDVLFHLSSLAQNKVALTCDRNCFTVASPHLLMIQPILGSSTVAIDGGYVSPVYGVKREAPIVKFSRNASICSFYTVVYPYKDKRPELAVTLQPVVVNGQIAPSFAASRLRVSINDGKQINTDTVFIANAPGEFYWGGIACSEALSWQRQNAQGQEIAGLNFPPQSGIPGIGQN
jgi:hypothetical protein